MRCASPPLPPPLLLPLPLVPAPPLLPPQVDVDDAEKMRDGGAQLDPFGRAATNALENELFSRHYESQFVNCDIRTFPMPVLGKFPASSMISAPP